ncbi:uncharacterized protein HMPREF1541_03597 [Cyphellophora europaea CBS 101466]|uniref:Heme haloperoxidase family profile domain-containing protein n=1 Tax=Cyphellophora europaea (strain CBS 101466) TaxID=1220924 RepID=W2RYS6_CYPE1|nr:uncharacterized protein HMPREF1541_03597 [Cyphellophora europaea CBS 101466]ETN41661.1 hypothetical protein HMPREF1541_03597 [Cyphellophora europaea CBS 101466]
MDEAKLGRTWALWSPPGRDEVRSPCPALNTLANHSIIPFDGRSISREAIIHALTRPDTFHLSPKMATLFAAGALKANPAPNATTFDLDMVDKHGFIEHDVSLSRDDIALSSNSTFSHDRFRETYGFWAGGRGEEAVVTYDEASKARYARVIQSQKRHVEVGKKVVYGIKEAILSYGESALFFNVLGKDGKVQL